MRAWPGKALIVALVTLAPAFASTARAQVAPCEASPKVKEALRNLPASTGDSQADRTATIAALKALLKRYPNDVFIHSRYQDEAADPDVKDRDAVIAEYRALAAKHPKDPIYDYLAGRAQIGVNTKEILPHLERLTSIVPSSRIALVQIYESVSFKDLDKARDHFQAFAKACPATLSAYQYLRSFGPSEFLTTSTATLRKVLQSRTDMDSLRYYSTLWNLEFRAKPATEHDALRTAIRADLTRLRSIDLGKNPRYYGILGEGYRLANDAEGEKWAAEQARSRFPLPSYETARDEYLKAHPYPKRTDPLEQAKAFYDAYAKAQAGWVPQQPYQVYVWLDWVRTLRQAEHASPADIETAGEGLLRAAAKNPHSMSFLTPVGGSSFALVVADLYANKGVRLERLPDLVREGIPELELLRTSGMPSDLYPSMDGPDSIQQQSRQAARWYGTATIADIWVTVKDKDRAREALTHLQALADQLKPTDPKDPKYATKQRTYLSRQVTYWRVMGDVAQLEGRKIDAMTFYQNALLARAEPPPGGQQDDLGQKARTLWKEIGGSNEAWQAWSTRRDLFGQGLTEVATGGQWTKLEKVLPEFELTDLSGVKWRLADFKGKTTLVGIWATW